MNSINPKYRLLGSPKTTTSNSFGDTPATSSPKDKGKSKAKTTESAPVTPIDALMAAHSLQDEDAFTRALDAQVKEMLEKEAKAAALAASGPRTELPPLGYESDSSHGWHGRSLSAGQSPLEQHIARQQGGQKAGAGLQGAELGERSDTRLLLERIRELEAAYLELEHDLETVLLEKDQYKQMYEKVMAAQKSSQNWSSSLSSDLGGYGLDNHEFLAARRKLEAEHAAKQERLRHLAGLARRSPLSRPLTRDPRPPGSFPLGSSNLFPPRGIGHRPNIEQWGSDPSFASSTGLFDNPFA